MLVVVLALVMRGEEAPGGLSSPSQEEEEVHHEAATLEGLPDQELRQEASAPEEELASQTPTSKPACSIRLQVYDGPTGAARGSTVTLWRIGLPAEDGWTAGDWRLQDIYVPDTGLLLEDMAVGEYRAIVHESAPGEDPSFTAKAPLTRVDLVVHPLPVFAVRVHLFDDQARPVTDVYQSIKYWESHHYPLATPAWAKPRELPPEEDPPEDELILIDEEMEYGERMAEDNDPMFQESPDGIYPIGHQHAAGRRGSSGIAYLFECQAEDKRVHSALVQVYAPMGHQLTDQGEFDYVAVLPDPVPWLERIRLDDGRNGFDIEQHVTVTGGALALGKTRPEARLQEVPITLKIEVPGYPKYSVRRALRHGPIDVELQASESE